MTSGVDACIDGIDIVHYRLSLPVAHQLHRGQATKARQRFRPVPGIGNQGRTEARFDPAQTCATTPANSGRLSSAEPSGCSTGATDGDGVASSFATAVAEDADGLGAALVQPVRTSVAATAKSASGRITSVRAAAAWDPRTLRV